MIETTSGKRPILFTGAMVLAIKKRQKTMTRRVIVPQPASLDRSKTPWASLEDLIASGPFQVGMRLWVRETWRPQIAHSHGQNSCDCADVNVTYAADGETRFFDEGEIPTEWRMPKAAARGNVSPLFMPRWASRLHLGVTGVRIERLNSISEKDVNAEGVFLLPSELYRDINTLSKLRRRFEKLWDSINGKGAYDENPWVRAVTFETLSD